MPVKLEGITMKFDKRRVALVFVLVTLIFSILTLLYWDFIRDTVIVPVYYLIWVSSLILKSIPQVGYLALIILISIMIAWNTLAHVKVRQLTRKVDGNHPQATTRYLNWRTLCANMYSSAFSRNQFAREARKLILSILAYQEGIDISEAEVLVRIGTLSVPDSIRNLIQQKDIQTSTLAPHGTKNVILRLRRFFLKVESQKDPQIDSQVAEIIDFIEHRLEINRA